MDDILAPRFIDPVAARKHLEALRWPDECRVPALRAYQRYRRRRAGREGLYQCNSCREQFTVTVGTVFERSKIAAQQVAALPITCLVRHQEGHERPSDRPYARRHLQNRLVHVPPHPRSHEGRLVAPLGGPGKIVESR